MVLLITSAFLSNTLVHGALLVVAIAAIKFLMVIFQFVEVNHAHLAWKVLSFIFVGTYLLGAILFSI